MSSIPDLTFKEKLISATFGGILTTLITTPLEVIKTRLQTVPNVPHSILSTTKGTRNSATSHPGLGIASQKQTAKLPVSFLSSFSVVIRSGGFRSLWSGLVPSVMMQVPATSFYFMVYDELKSKIEQSNNGVLAAYSPLVSGILARTVSTTIVSPLDLLRTKAMYYGGGATQVNAGSLADPSIKPTRLSLIGLVRSELSAGSILSLWRGLVPTLWRDVPFSGFYWLGYEKSKDILTPYFHASERSAYSSAWIVAFISGFLSGSFAAIVTNPLDVVKTRRQVQLYSNSSWPTEPKLVVAANCHRPSYMRQTPKLLNPQQCALRESVAYATPAKAPTATKDILRAIARNEGVAGLFAGLTARLARVGPACAIMISSYELGKVYFGHANKSASIERA